MDKTVLYVIAFTLIIAAVLLYFSVCEWDERAGSSASTAIILCFQTRHNVPVPIAGIVGLFLPALIAGGGVALLVFTDKKKR